MPCKKTKSVKSATPAGLIPKRSSGLPLLDVALPAPERETAFVPSKPRSSRNRKSAGAKKRRAEKQHKRWVDKITLERNRSMKDRCAQVHLFGPVIAPSLQFREDLLSCNPDQSAQVTEFYNSGANVSLRLSEDGEPNVSNPSGTLGGGRGVFAAKDLPARTSLCPYLGHSRRTRCARDVACKYCLKVGPDSVICAREVLYDVGWLLARNAGKRALAVYDEGSCEPNYSRYFNSVPGGKAEDFNVAFEGEEGGHLLCFLETTRAVSKGDELLVDYGAGFEW